MGCLTAGGGLTGVFGIGSDSVGDVGRGGVSVFNPHEGLLL